MPYKTLKKSKPEYDLDYIQQKIALIEKGLPIEVFESELKALEHMLRGAFSFYVDLLLILETHRSQGKDVEEDYACEAKNLASISIALRKVDVFRDKHGNVIKK